MTIVMIVMYPGWFDTYTLLVHQQLVTTVGTHGTPSSQLQL